MVHNILRSKSKVQLLHLALILSFITVSYNLIEGLVSTLFGASDETLALFGFGVDSFVEVISGIGIAHMIYRIRKSPVSDRDQFERNALRLTGVSFFILTVGLVIGAAYMIYFGGQPSTTLIGIIISSISIMTMYALYKFKLLTGQLLNSAPIISDANCTKTCFYLSFILLGSSLLYELFSVPYVDAIGSLGIAWYAYKEGKEALEKSKVAEVGSDDCC